MNIPENEIMLACGRTIAGKMLDEVGYISAIGWTDKELAVYVGLSPEEFRSEMSDEAGGY